MAMPMLELPLTRLALCFQHRASHPLPQGARDEISLTSRHYAIEFGTSNSAR